MAVLHPQVFESEGLEKKEVSTTPALYQKLYRRALQGKLSPRMAIKAKCYECCNFEEVHTRVDECSSYGCPLWPYRPMTKKGKDKAK